MNYPLSMLVIFISGTLFGFAIHAIFFNGANKNEKK